MLSHDRGYITLLLLMLMLFSFFLSGGMINLTSTSPDTTETSLSITDNSFPANETLQIIPLEPQAHSKSEVDFSAPGFDWDDAIGWFFNNCQTLSAQCLGEANQGVNVEIYESPSRVSLCRGNAACRKDGYSAYDGPVPLPTFVPSENCLTQFYVCYDKFVSDYSSNPFDISEILNTNCDNSDGICSANPMQQAQDNR